MRIPKETSLLFENNKSALKRTWDEMELTPESKLISYPYEELNKDLGGIYPSSLVIVAAETGQGKSQFVNNLAMNAVREKRNVVYFDLENDFGDMVRRNIAIKMSNRLGIPVNPCDLKTQKAIKTDYDKKIITECYTELKNELSDHILLYNNDDVLNIEKFIYHLDNISYINEVDLVVIDHLHYFDFNSFGGENGNKNYSESIGEIMRALRQITRERNIPVVLVSHLRKRQNRKELPSNDDLFGSSNIAKEAEQVIILSRNKDEEFSSIIQITKNRNSGILSTYLAKYNQKTRKFYNLTVYNENN